MKNTVRIRKRRVAVAVAIPLLGIAALAAFELTFDVWVEQQARLALLGSSDWEGEIGDLSFSLLRGRGSVSDLDVRAMDPSKVLRRIHVAEAEFTFSRWEMVHGHAHLVAIVHEPTVETRKRTGGPRKDVPRPDPGFFRFSLDSQIVAGRWVWRDGSDPDFAHVLTGVRGIYDHLGTADGNGKIDVLAQVEGGGIVHAHGSLDFWNAHRDAIDLQVGFIGLSEAFLQGADALYVGADVLQGRFDGVMSITVDQGGQELPTQDVYMAGPVADLSRGRMRGWLTARELVIGGVPTDPLQITSVTIDADGPVTGDEPLRVQVVVDGLAVTARRSRFAGRARPKGTPEQLFSLLPSFDGSSIHARGTSLTWVDDALEPAVALGLVGLDLTVDNFQNMRPGDRARVVLTGPFSGGSIRASGTSDLTRWPPPTDAVAALVDIDAVQLVQSLAGYTDIKVDRGVFQGDASFSIDEQGRVDRQVRLDATDLVGRAQGWNAGITRGHIDVFGGTARVGGVHLTPPNAEGAFLSAEAESVHVAWDVDRFFATRALRATVRFERPVVVSQRPRATGVMERPSARFGLDVHVSRGRLEWRDDTVSPAVSLVLDPFDASVTDLGTLSDRAVWRLSGGLERGGRLDGWARVDAFAGPGRSSDLAAQARLDQIDLRDFSSITRAYLGLEADGGRASATVVMDGEGGVLQVETHDLLLRHPAGLGELASDTARASFSWIDAEGARGRTLLGTAWGARLVVRPEAGTRSGKPLQAPTLRIPHLDLREVDVVIEDFGGTQESLAVHDASISVRDATLGQHGESGQVWLAGTLWDGRIDVELTAGGAQPYRVQARGAGIELARANEWLRPATGIDVDAGHAAFNGDVSLSPSGFLGAVDVTISDADVLQGADLRRGIGVWLKNAAVGAGLGLAARKGVARVRLDVRGTPARPKVAIIRAVADAILARHGLRPAPAEALIGPTEMPEPLDTVVVDYAALSAE
jgi:hypothetical protein